ncbi:hypothetical protein IFR05_015373 [Cadophora sp. M221]|nr:hypothetical protein IFR05_015373 [Cadophora sp. M221]
MARLPRKAQGVRGKVNVQPSNSSNSYTQKTKSGYTIYIDDDDTPPPETGLGKPSKGTKALASSSDYGGSSDKEDMIAAAAQIELMRSWVDCGIQLAIKEAEKEAGGLAGGRVSECLSVDLNNILSQSTQVPTSRTTEPPHTPVSRSYPHNAPYATPSQSQNIPPQYHLHCLPQSHSMGSIQGYQDYPASSMPPQPQSHYTPQHGMAYASQFPPQNTIQVPPQGHYTTPPTSQPPFLRPTGPFSSSAPPPSNPTPQPYTMKAFHNSSIPRSSGFISTTRQPLTPASSSVQALTPSAEVQVSEQPFVLPEHRYGPARETLQSDDSYNSARFDWVIVVKMDDPTFYVAWAAIYKRQEAEDNWAGLPAQKRQFVEMSALEYRYRAVVQAPSREVPPDAFPLSFMSIEVPYFNLPERKLANNSDTIYKRSIRLREFGLLQPIYHALCSTTKAKFLKVKLNPPKPLFKDFEVQYSVHKEEFARKDDYKAKRSEWLRAIGLDDEPFCWHPYNTTELGIVQEEKTEVAWNDLDHAARQAIEAKASEIDKLHTWGASWGYIEAAIGFTPVVGERWTQWPTAIGMGRAMKSDETRNGVWQKKSAADRQAIYRLAIVQRREIQVRWDARQVTQAKATRTSRVKPTKKPAKVVKSKSSNPPSGYGRSYGRG